jgi:acetoin utilization deacetylase AcuC-like enzyme
MSYITGVVADRRYMDHDPGCGHPESPERLAAVYDMLDGADMKNKFFRIEPRKALVEELARIHRHSYIDRVAATAGMMYSALDIDTIASPGSYDAALLAAGGLMNAVDDVMDGTVRNAFAFVRPPGHHAETAASGGFCIFNNVAVAAAHARERYGLERILIADWDLHHGNGTQRSFYGDPGVLYFSTHQYPFYPGTGSAGELGVGPGEGYTVNVPLQRGQGDAEYLKIFKKILDPLATAYRPELVLVSAGFDICRGDALGGMNVTEEGFVKLTRVFMDIADRCCGGRLVFTLEGGYNISMMARSAGAMLLEMSGETETGGRKPDETPEGADEKTDMLVRNILQRLRPFWNL